MQDYTRWLLPKVQSYENVNVVPHVSAESYYKALAALIRMMKKGDIIFFSGYVLDVSQRLGANSPQEPTVVDVLKEAVSKRRVKVRALLDFDQLQLVGPNAFRATINKRAEKAIKALGGEARIDNQQRLLGSHHQKLVFLTVNGEPHAFCGGIDIADRWTWRDVQVQIAGGPALEVFATLTQRWNSLVGGGQLNHPAPPIAASRSRKALNHVQFVRTYGKEDWYARDRGRKYAKGGEYDVHAMLSHAVRRAHRLIYIEDQYFFLSRMAGLEHIGELLAKQLGNTPDLILIIILCQIELIEAELRAQAPFRRRQLLDVIGASIKDVQNRVRVFQYKKDLPGGPDFIHSKVWIFDDEFAVVGSANVNRRGMSHDSEAAFGITGPGEGPYPFARKLRIQMWLQHLNHASGAKGGFLQSHVSEAKPGLQHLESDNSPLERYLPVGTIPSKYDTDRWEGLLDPDGS